MPQTRKSITCKYLNELYVKKQLSLLCIGKLLGFSSRTIEIRARECKIPLRKPGFIPPEISDKELLHLYLIKKLSSRKIAGIYKCSYSYIDTKIKSLNIPRRNLSSAHITTKRKNFSGDLREKAYMTGFAIGDLRVRKMYKNSETILVDCGSTKINQIRLIKKIFSAYGRVWTSKLKSNNKIQIECGLNDSFKFLLKKHEIFPAWAMRTRELYLSIIAGFIDAEGSFYVYNNERSSGFSVGNYNKKILIQIQNKLHDLRLSTKLFKGVKKGYTGKDGYSHSSDYWILSINKKKDLFNFIKIIFPFLQHKDRIECAKKVVKNIEIRNQKYGFIRM